MRSALVYALLVGAPLGLLFLILGHGAGLAPGLPPAATETARELAKSPHFLSTLLLQIAVVLVAARAMGALFRRLHQPQVVGEMVAGIMLGPSLLGWLAPGVSAVLFPTESLAYLNTLSQVGLVLFMFLVGLEFDPLLLRGRRSTALVTSHVSIVAPFMLGAALALFLYPRLAEGHVTFTGFALFMGAAMSITAFPVLARILSERNLMQTELGALTIACAAVDDVSAWSILAVVIAIVRADAAATPLYVTLGGSALFVLLMVSVVRRALLWLESYYHSRGRFTQDMLAIVLLALLVSSFTTEWLGIHALFGAFLIGAVMPKDAGFVHDLSRRLEDVTVVFLLPLFFAFTGLRTSIGLVAGAELWFYAGLILAVAVAGKFGGSALAARATGLPWRESAALGILMNTRGLMELVILTIGLDLGVISPTLFTMMVLMALITTFMTTPLLQWIYPARLIRRQAVGGAARAPAVTTLIPVSLPSAGPGLVAMARLLGPADGRHHVYALHLRVAADEPLTQVTTDRLPAEERVLRPLLGAARTLGVKVRPLSFVSRDPAADIADVAELKRADLVLMGSHKPVIARSVLGGTVNEVLGRAPCDVAVLMERSAPPYRRILVPWAGSTHDAAALEYARRIAAASGATLTVLQVADPHQPPPPAPPACGGAEQVTVHAADGAHAVAAHAADGYDLVVVGAARVWGLEPSVFAQQDEALARVGSATLLIVRAGERHARIAPQAARQRHDSATRGS